jgi:inner membrane protein
VAIGATLSALAVLSSLVLLRWGGFRHASSDPLVIGYHSHLGGDLLGPGGLRLVWPSRQRQAIPLCRTGSVGEVVIVTGMALGRPYDPSPASGL